MNSDAELFRHPLRATGIAGLIADPECVAALCTLDLDVPGRIRSTTSSMAWSPARRDRD